MLYNSTNHVVVCIDQVVEYTDHVVGCTSHGDLLGIDQDDSIYQARDAGPERDGGKTKVNISKSTSMPR